MREFLKHLWVTGLLIVLLIACHYASPDLASLPTRTEIAENSACRVIGHDVGKTQVCGQPQRIAVLSPHMLDILLSLGMQPAGFAEFSTVQVGKPINHIPVLGDWVTSQPINLGLRNTPSLEALLRLKPDLIIGEVFQQEYYRQLSQIAPTLLYEGSLKDEWQQGLRGVAQAIRRETQAEQVIQTYRQKLADASTALAPIFALKPNLLLMAAYQLPQTFGVSDGQDFLGGLFADLGFQLVVPRTAHPTESWLSIETLPQLKADIILALISDHLRQDALSHTQQVWQQNPITQSLPASQTGQIYFLDAYLFYNIRGPIAAALILDKIQQLFTSATEKP